MTLREYLEKWDEPLNEAQYFATLLGTVPKKSNQYKDAKIFTLGGSLFTFEPENGSFLNQKRYECDTDEKTEIYLKTISKVTGQDVGFIEKKINEFINKK